MMATGKCLCGTVAYEISGDPLAVMNCHCQRCRRFTGSTYEAFMLIQLDQLRIIRGRENIQLYAEDGFVNRSFCKTCGSSLFTYQWPEGPMIALTLGPLDDEAEFVPTMHINVASKAPWHEITDGLPQVDGRPDRA